MVNIVSGLEEIVNLGISLFNARNKVPYRQPSRLTETRKPMELRGPRPVRQLSRSPTMSVRTSHGIACCIPGTVRKSPTARFPVWLRHGVLKTLIPVTCCTDVASSGLRARHSFEALSVPMERLINRRIRRSRTVSAKVVQNPRLPVGIYRCGL
jgi:hypothetical protein